MHALHIYENQMHHNQGFENNGGCIYLTASKKEIFVLEFESKHFSLKIHVEILFKLIEIAILAKYCNFRNMSLPHL